MPPLEEMDLNERAVYWAKVGDDDYGRAILTDTPVEIPCRWEHNQQDVRENEGNIKIYNALVVLDRKVQVGSVLWLGTLASWYGTGSIGPADADDTKERSQVVKASNSPDQRALFRRYTVQTQRYRDVTSDPVSY